MEAAVGAQGLPAVDQRQRLRESLKPIVLVQELPYGQTRSQISGSPMQSASRSNENRLLEQSLTGRLFRELQEGLDVRVRILARHGTSERNRTQPRCHPLPQPGL